MHVDLRVCLVDGSQRTYTVGLRTCSLCDLIYPMLVHIDLLCCAACIHVHFLCTAHKRVHGMHEPHLTWDRCQKLRSRVGTADWPWLARRCPECRGHSHTTTHVTLQLHSISIIILIPDTGYTDSMGYCVPTLAADTLYNVMHSWGGSRSA